MFYLYILRSNDNRLYIGQTNLEKRLAYHASRQAANYTKHFEDFTLVYSELFPDRISAMRREKQLQGWTRAKKEALIIGDFQQLKRL